jgi:DNA modification methylase
MALTPYFERDGIVIYHADCRDVLPGLNRSTVDVLLTDPPYGIAYATNYAVRGVGASWLGTEIANDGDTDLRDWVVRWGAGLPMFVFGSWKRQPPIGTHTVLVWDKGPASGMGNLAVPWKPSWEAIYVVGQGRWRGNRESAVVSGYTVLTWESKGRQHPNEKPVSLLTYLLQRIDADVVLDPFAGSGSTLMAVKMLGRKAIGIEIEERYCEIAATRLAQEVLPLGVA